jgi:hypothetical protein
VVGRTLDTFPVFQRHPEHGLYSAARDIDHAGVSDHAGLFVQVAETHFSHAIPTEVGVPLAPDLLVGCGLELPPEVLDLHGVQPTLVPPHPARQVEDHLGSLGQTGGAVPNPLPSDEDWKPDEKLELDHFEWGGVAMAHQVSNQAAVVSNRTGTLTVRDTCGLNDGSIVPHVIDQRDESVR